jgi:hypothetical protein
LTKS